MWKKIERVLDIIFIIFKWLYLALVFVGFLGGAVVFFREFMPVTRTHFKSYQAYLDNRTVRRSYGTTYFEEELPIGTEDVKYYSEYVLSKRVTGYSLVLPEKTYREFMKSRIDFYVEKSDAWGCSLLYAPQGDGRQYIDGSEWYDKKLDYVDNLLHHPEVRQQYYFGVIMKTNVAGDGCYTGIIANDEAHEIIEFSAELPDDYGEHREESERSPGEILLGWLHLLLTAAFIALIIRGMYALDKKLDKKWGKKYYNYSQFEKELPTIVNDSENYRRSESGEDFAVYSTVLTEENFKTFSEERRKFFRKEAEDFSTTRRVIYLSQGEERCYVDDPKWCDNEVIGEEDLAFIDDAIGNPKAKDQYYYLVVMRIDREDTVCYHGVILNDATREFIEFRTSVVDHGK